MDSCRRLVFCLLCAALLCGCGESPNGYYPLDNGHWWYYETTLTILDETKTQRLLVSNIGTGNFQGRAVAIQRQSSGREIYIDRTEDGIQRVGVRAGFADSGDPAPATTLLPNDFAAGSSWQTPTKLTLIESRTFARQDKLRGKTLPLTLNMVVASVADEITVPAGRFTDCLRVDGRGERSVRTDRGNASADVVVETQEWYAPGVGLVKATRREFADSPFLKAGHYTQVLVQHER